MAQELNNPPVGGLKPRPPVVVVMGHVDHGKTTLLDYIRKTNVASREAGGITQSIGAYEIEHGGKKITFIDTPGHEAFTKMRSRGANIADLAILVVAADEGMKPQTKESVKILEESKTPFIVAITKIDKNNADIERAKNELMSNGVLLEGYGGNISYQPVSAKTGEGVNELLDLILLAAELENLTYDEEVAASGYVLEAKIDQRRGLEASVIVKNGILKTGDCVSTETSKGRIKIMENFLGKPAMGLLPSSPAMIIGFETLPQVGEKFSASGTVSVLEVKPPTLSRVEGPVLNRVEGASLSASGEDKVKLRLMIKASDSGSLEVLSGIIKAIALQKPIKVIDESVGDIGDNDVKLAASTKAMVIAFRSKIGKSSKFIADTSGVKIISSEIIYELLKAIDDFLLQLEKPAPVGALKVLAVFNQSEPQKQVVGGKVESGVFKNKTLFEIERDGAVVGAGRVINLQQQKKDTIEAAEGKEAGLLVSSETILKTGDLLVIRK